VPDQDPMEPDEARPCSRPEGRSPARKERSVLRHCLSVLAQREAEDRDFSWLWAAKRKVATYCLKLLEPDGASRDDAEGPELTPEERDQVLRTHPLLQKGLVPATSAPPHEHADWFQELRRKAQEFARQFAEENQENRATRARETHARGMRRNQGPCP